MLIHVVEIVTLIVGDLRCEVVSIVGDLRCEVVSIVVVGVCFVKIAAIFIGSWSLFVLVDVLDSL